VSVLPDDLEEAVVELDPFGADIARGAPEPLAAFNLAGVLAAGDIHVARTLCALASVAAGEPDGGSVLLATALAVRAPRLGSVLVDLETISQTVAVENEELPIAELPWPQAPAWLAAVSAATGLVALGDADTPEPRPLRLLGSRLYLDRYWRQERALAAALRAHAEAPLARVELADLEAGIARMFPGDDDLGQRLAAASGVLRGLTVIAGGPGTGKTTTVARIAALLAELAARDGAPPPLIALCAPTGKAAARMQEAVHDQADRLPVSDEVRGWLRALPASTIHRLLSWSYGRPRHNADNRLPHDVVIVDETSMVSLSLVARLLEAVRSDARVVLVGDPDQLSAIEAGAVLRDIVGPAADGPGRAGAGPSFGDGVVVLSRGHRFGATIASLADAIRRGDADAAVAALVDGGDEITWLTGDADEITHPGGPTLAATWPPKSPLGLREPAVAAYAAVVTAARVGDGAAALAALGGFRLLCAHRRGADGVSTWAARVERWLADAIEGFEPGDRSYAGRPLLITANDRELRLFNGDTGVVVDTAEGEQLAMFEREGGLVGFAPSRLDAVETLYAMTIHKAQGSQFGVAAVVLPDPGSRILTRELLYTAVTRVRDRLILVGGEDAIRAAIARPVARASGLRELLWLSPDSGSPPGP